MRTVAVGVQRPGPAVAPPQRAALDQVLQGLLEEEGVAAGALRQQVDDRRRQLRLGQRGRQRAAGVGVQRAQLDLVVAVRVQLAGALAEPPGRGVAVGAVEEDDAELRLLRQPEQLLQQLQRGVVRPLQVVDGEAQRPLVGEGAHHVAHGREGPRLHRLAAEVAQRGARLVGERHAEQPRQERVGLVDLAGQRAERRLQLQAHAGLGRVGGDAEPVAQQVAHRPVRRALRSRWSRGPPGSRRGRRRAAAPRPAGASCRCRARR